MRNAAMLGSIAEPFQKLASRMDVLSFQVFWSHLPLNTTSQKLFILTYEFLNNLTVFKFFREHGREYGDATSSSILVAEFSSIFSIFFGFCARLRQFRNAALPIALK